MSVFSLADIVNLCTFWPKHTLSSTTFTCTSNSVEALYSGCGHIPNTVYAYRHRNIPVYMVASILELPFINAEPTDVTASVSSHNSLWTEHVHMSSFSGFYE